MTIGYHQKRFIDWFEDQKANHGLIDVKAFPVPFDQTLTNSDNGF